MIENKELIMKIVFRIEIWNTRTLMTLLIMLIILLWKLLLEGDHLNTEL